jgi:SPP1 family predicted phage head-tail adaptor
MQAGRLDRRITIEQPTESTGAIGDVTESWSDFATVWAGKDDRSGREALSPEIERGEVETVWRIRHLDGLTMKMRIVYDGRIYDIRSIREIGRGEGWIIGTTAERE